MGSARATTSAPVVNLEKRFVSELPGDPLTNTGTRQVFEACYSRVAPTPVKAPDLVAYAAELAEHLGLEAVPTPALVALLAGNALPPEAVPFAACYGGHQFGHWAGQLGDGRAIGLGEVRARDGALWEVQLKGAGPTPYSRFADGRAVLRSSLREYVASEAMAALGVPTTRALSLVTTGEAVERDILYSGHSRPEAGAIVCRVAESFLRFGSYELHAARRDTATLRRLLAFTLRHYFPAHLQEALRNPSPQGPEPAAPSLATSADFAVTEPAIVAFFREVCRRTVALVLHWQRVGFVHGVMNTDNMSILGLTIDYGPYAFLDTFDLSFTPNLTDSAESRYAFGRQGDVALWNLQALARSLAPLLTSANGLADALDDARHVFAQNLGEMWLSKLGIEASEDHAAEDAGWVGELMSLLALRETDMTLFFRVLADIPLSDGADSEDRSAAMRLPQALETLVPAFYGRPPDASRYEAALAAWLGRYAERVRRASLSDSARRERMHRVNPLYVPRNYLLQEISNEVEAGDSSSLEALMRVLKQPYDKQTGAERFAEKRPDWARNKPLYSVLSCSS